MPGDRWTCHAARHLPVWAARRVTPGRGRWLYAPMIWFRVGTGRLNSSDLGQIPRVDELCVTRPEPGRRRHAPTASQTRTPTASAATGANDDGTTSGPFRPKWLGHRLVTRSAVTSVSWESSFVVTVPDVHLDTPTRLQARSRVACAAP